MKKGAKVLLFAEWPRRGWDETGYILSEYGKISQAAKGAKIMPIPQGWDRARNAMPKLEMWQPDGNHAAFAGSYLAACVISREIAGKGSTLSWSPRGLETTTAKRLREFAK